MNIPLIDLKAQIKTLEPEISQALLEAFRGAQYIIGPNVKAFEAEMQEFLSVKHAISVANGTDALVIALRSLGISEGDEVILTTFSYFASAESIAALGARPVFIDVEEDTYNIDVTKIEEKITERTKAIMAVHIFGQPCDMDAIQALAKQYGLFIIEDAAQAIGASYQGKMAGTLGDIATFSFFPTKNLGAAGDGGMIVTNNDRLAALARALRTHGSGVAGEKAFLLLNGQELADSQEEKDNTVYNAAKYYNYLVGYNSRLDEVQAAILRVKLRQLQTWNDTRQAFAKDYEEAFRGSALQTPLVREDRISAYHMYVVRSDERARLTAELSKAGIATGIYYPVPLHLQKAFWHLGYEEGDFPVAESLSGRTFAIPIYPELSPEQRGYITETLKGLL